MTRCAQLLEEKTNIDFIDINVGSPGEMVRTPRFVWFFVRTLVVHSHS